MKILKWRRSNQNTSSHVSNVHKMDYGTNCGILQIKIMLQLIRSPLHHIDFSIQSPSYPGSMLDGIAEATTS